MFKWLDWNLLQTVLRHGLTALGGVLVGAGWIDASAVPELVGAALVIVGAIFGAVSAKTKTEAQQVEKAVEASPTINAVKVAPDKVVLVGTGAGVVPAGKKV